MKAAAILGVMVFFAGCDPNGEDPRPIGSPDSSQSVVDPEDPCRFLSPTQVQDAIGTEVTSEQEVASHDPSARICSYQTTEPWASVGVVLETGIPRSEFEGRARRDAINTEAAAGIGDAAFIYGCASINVLVGEVVVSMSVQHLTTCEETGEVLRNLGREAADQLPMRIATPEDSG